MSIVSSDKFKNNLIFLLEELRSFYYELSLEHEDIQYNSNVMTFIINYLETTTNIDYIIYNFIRYSHVYWDKVMEDDVEYFFENLNNIFEFLYKSDLVDSVNTLIDVNKYVDKYRNQVISTIVRVKNMGLVPNDIMKTTRKVVISLIKLSLSFLKLDTSNEGKIIVEEILNNNIDDLVSVWKTIKY